MLSLCIVFGLFGLPSCGQMEPIPSPDTDTPARLVFSVDLARWDAPATKAGASGTSWPDNTSIYIMLKSGNQTLSARAWRSSGADNWNLQRVHFETGSYYWAAITSSDLAPFSSGNCVCYYFEDRYGNSVGQTYDSAQNLFYVDLNSTCAVYADKEARYGIVDGELTIKAHLTPMTGRIRFTKSPEESYNYFYADIYGLKTSKLLDLSTFEMDYSQSVSSYYTTYEDNVYFYGSFSDPERRTLTVADRKWGDPPYFERFFYEDIMAPGKSNVSDWPLEAAHNEWYLYNYSLHISNIKLLYVAPGTFQMGGEDAGPIHQVTFSQGYYLGETEVTRDTWYRVMGEPSYWVDSEVPVTNKSWDEVQEFIVRLNAQSGYKFRLPTEAEWEFAARGALRTNGYKYSGSDTMAEVAVHDSDVKSVKTREANEWGFYDMSGNAAEWVSDWMGEYPDEAVVDPTGPETGDTHITRGGESYGGESTMTVTFRNRRATPYRTGFRLAMDAPKIQ